jgi:hypothetical protein
MLKDKRKKNRYCLQSSFVFLFAVLLYVTRHAFNFCFSRCLNALQCVSDKGRCNVVSLLLTVVATPLLKDAIHMVQNQKMTDMLHWFRINEETFTTRWSCFKRFIGGQSLLAVLNKIWLADDSWSFLSCSPVITVSNCCPWSALRPHERCVSYHMYSFAGIEHEAGNGSVGIMSGPLPGWLRNRNSIPGRNKGLLILLQSFRRLLWLSQFHIQWVLSLRYRFPPGIKRQELDSKLSAP